MTLAHLIAEIEEVKPNQYRKEILTRWVSEVENIAVEQVLNRVKDIDIDFEAYDYDLDQETELKIPDRFADVYINYVGAKIDDANREYDGYNNSVIKYESSFQEFAAYWKRTHTPKPLAYMKHL